MQQTINYRIIRSFGKLSDNGRGESKQVNYISYNNFKPKIDIRKWATGEDGSPIMAKGVTLSIEEAAELKAILNDIDLDELAEESDNNKGFTGGGFGGGKLGSAKMPPSGSFGTGRIPFDAK